MPTTRPEAMPPGRLLLRPTRKQLWPGHQPTSTALAPNSRSLDACWSFLARKPGGEPKRCKGAIDREGEPVPADEVPREVEQATYEAALRELLKPGSLNPDYVATTAVKRAKVGPLETEFFGPAEGDEQPNKPFVGVINDLLAPIMVLRCPMPAVFTV